MALLVWVALIGGCGAMPAQRELESGTAALTQPGFAAASDARAAFRAVFCEALADAAASEAAPGGCDEYLWRLPDEAAPPAPRTGLPALHPALRVFVVGGAFSDCFGASSLAFGPAVATLRADGVAVSEAGISSRSSARYNASLLAVTISAARLKPEDVVVLVGYSKGTVDILEFLAAYPELAAGIDAVVSVAGAVHGSSLAASGAWAYDSLLEHAFEDRCPAGDGGVVDSLLPELRDRWLRENPPPAGIRYYTVSAFAASDRMALALRPSWQQLTAKDIRNDGQLTVAESLLPGSALLGYVNSDHWGVAIAVEESLGAVVARRDDRPFPQTVLLESILRFVSADVAKGSAAGARE
jgi:hypothetical protein